MIKDLFFRAKQNERLPLYFLLLLSCLFCFIISLCRVYITASPMFFLFLNKNLFLAFIPFAISSYLLLFPEVKERKSVFFFWAFCWMIFFPNAPYIVTDLFHLKTRVDAALWLDLGILFAFAWTGLMFGIISLMDMSEFFNEKVGAFFTNIGITFFLFLTGFGLYLGRYLRWNSWDIIHHPMELFGDILHRLLFPFDHPGTWGMTLLFGSLLNIIYWTIKVMRK
ncbi:MAG: DUF1361 domain-containing protein [Bacteroidetes bacterium]|nr:DUF1361 domain-containing protein [Bacteroidota bacterium]